ncbi:MAG: hypothetical protein NZM07_00985, partial [Elioraea sp.]|nr:hypothetical protein [Elioraea sp.]
AAVWIAPSPPRRAPASPVGEAAADAWIDWAERAVKVVLALLAIPAGVVLVWLCADLDALPVWASVAGVVFGAALAMVGFTHVADALGITVIFGNFGVREEDEIIYDPAFSNFRCNIFHRRHS